MSVGRTLDMMEEHSSNVIMDEKGFFSGSLLVLLTHDLAKQKNGSHSSLRYPAGHTGLIAYSESPICKS
ncbi:Hypothetical predicted protein [Octopus vulgaris]|uniref:Uncharacterized protein n=1 Tax=Octopus vulgaris TaxID=6645 RepID=A0AA36B0D8_OCTVU|nr:Hypothetical predicted protein [Octopus vulgaris]